MESFVDSSTKLHRLLQTLCNLAIQAGKASLVHYNSHDIKTEIKADNSPLTQADLEADDIICSGLELAYPHVPIVTEEKYDSHKYAACDRPFFLVDPIDGTKEFIKKNGEFTINIALVEDHIPIAGVVFAPALDRLFYAAFSIGAFEKSQNFKQREEPGRKLSCSHKESKKLIAIASRSHMKPENAQFLEINNIDQCINAGSSLKFCLLAANEAQIYPRFGPTMEWDTAAGHAVLTVAGGEVKTLDGKNLVYGKTGFINPSFIATSNGVNYVLPDVQTEANP